MKLVLRITWENAAGRAIVSLQNFELRYEIGQVASVHFEGRGRSGVHKQTHPGVAPANKSTSRMWKLEAVLSSDSSRRISHVAGEEKEPERGRAQDYHRYRP